MGVVTDARGEPQVAAPRSTSGSRRRLLRYLPHAIVATFVVSILPLAVVTSLELSGVIGSAVAVVLGVGLSAGAAAIGAALWKRHPGARDLVFGDLMLWGWLMRVRTERSIPGMIDLLSGAESDAGDLPMDAERRIAILSKLAAALEARDPHTHGHTARVARHAYMIAKTMGLPAAETRKIRTAAAVHDVGKVRVPDEVLNKPGRLTDEEFALIKEHARAGAEMVSTAGDPELTALVRHHHERLDGRGYPDGLEGGDIPLGARVIAVADTFDAITSTRSYRSAAPHKKALEILRKEAGSQLDPDAVAAFLAYYSGKASKTWWASLTTIPQRIAVRFWMWIQQGGVAQLANAAVATTAAAAVTASGGTGAVPKPNVPQARVAMAVPADRSRGAGEVRGSGASATSGEARNGARRGANEGAERGRPGARAQGKAANADEPRTGGSNDDPVDTGATDPAPSVDPTPAPVPPGGGGSGGGGSGGGGSGSGGGGGLEDAVDDVGGAVGDIGGDVGDAVDDVGDTVDDVADDLNDTVGGVGKDLNDAVDRLGDAP